MALYYEAATFLTPTGLASSDSLASRVYSTKDLKSQATQLYALLAESARWSAVLSHVIETADILKQERKLTPALAILLTYDLLLSKRGIAAPKDHVLSLCITRHRARLSAEFTKSRVKAGYATVEAWQEALKSKGAAGHDVDPRHPRWVRINTLRTTLEDQAKSGFLSDRRKISRIPQGAGHGSDAYCTDENIDDLVAVAAGTDLSKTRAYRAGEIILQDKASCFSAFLLQPSRHDRDVIDGCAAPGNKTTHLSALLQKALPGHKNTIFAVERNLERSATLQKMITIAHADRHGVEVLANQDFSRLDPSDQRFQHVTAILLDPSCSGSGIVGRDQGDDAGIVRFTMPRSRDAMASSPISSSGRPHKKRKTDPVIQPKGPKSGAETEQQQPRDSAPALDDRLQNLSAFQLSLVLHAFTFPNARKLVYSTCSIHAAENEHVVMKALKSDVARRRGWKILKRQDQVQGMRGWPHRGSLQALSQTDARTGFAFEIEDIAEGCIRCHRGTDDGTMGFFVAAFYRDMEQPRDYWCSEVIAHSTPPSVSAAEQDEEEMWEGLSEA